MRSPGATPRRLVIFARPVGFFSLFTQVVGQLARCRRVGTTPLVYFNRCCPYWSDAGYRGARNVWDYYFQPVSDARITDWVDAEPARLEGATIWDFDRCEPDGTDRAPPGPRGRIRTRPGVLVSSRYPDDQVDWLFGVSTATRRALIEIVRQEIVVRPEILAQVDAFAAAHFSGRPVAGVHIRGVEHAVERRLLAPGGTLPLDCYAREIDAFLRVRPAAAVFCASDSLAALDFLRTRYGERLVARDVVRLPVDQEAIGLHGSTETKHIRPRLGEEVLVDCLLLARCDRLIHGHSNVSLAASLFSPELPRTDVYRKYGRSLLEVRWRRWRHDRVPLPARLIRRVPPSIRTLLRPLRVLLPGKRT